VALAVQDVALKAGDSTAEPANQRSLLSAELPDVQWPKLGNKVLSYLQDSLRTRLWSAGGMWLTAFFVAGWLYAFRGGAANRLRWTFTAALALLLAAQAVGNSGECERHVASWLAPLMMIFGAGFFFVLLGSNPRLAAWPRACAGALLLAQALPLLHDVLEPRRMHINYPPYYPALFVGMRQELARRDDTGRFGVMADVPAGVAWYGRQRVWAQPVNLRDFYTVTVELQSIAELLLSPRTLDRPFFSELNPRPPAGGPAPDKLGNWGAIYGGIVTGSLPANFPLRVPQRIADNLYVMLNPALPAPRGK
jgi:cbb3-type cytochrome oxidase subunit 3